MARTFNVGSTGLEGIDGRPVGDGNATVAVVSKSDVVVHDNPTYEAPASDVPALGVNPNPFA